MSIDIQTIISTIEGKVVDYAKTNLTELATNAVSDAQGLFATIKSNLVRRTQMLAEGQLTKDEFAGLLLADADLVQMDALTQAGLALAKIDAFKQGIFQVIIDSVTSMI